MADINTITLTGRCGAAPELKAFESGAILATFPLAVNRWNKKNKEEVTDWFTIKTFSKLAEYIQKGNKLCLSGSLETSTWETEDGEKKKSYNILAQTIVILNSKNETNLTNENEEIVEFSEEEIPF